MLGRQVPRLASCAGASPSCSSGRGRASRPTQAQSLGSWDSDDADSKRIARGSAAGPLRVFTPLAEATAAIGNAWQELGARSGLMPDATKVSLKDIQRPVDEDMEICRQNLVDVVGRRHPLLRAAADQIFSAGGKRLRPLIVLLVARATVPMHGLTDLTDRHRRLSEITEMIHTASLVHDDVLDECDIRRGETPGPVTAHLYHLYCCTSNVVVMRLSMWLTFEFDA